VTLLDAARGRARWTAPVVGVRRYRPALGADRVAATSETELVVLDRADGRRVAAVAYPGPGPAAVLDTAAGRLVVAGSESGAVLALDATSGATRWSIAHPGAVTVAAQVAGPVVVAVWSSGDAATLRALDPATGLVRWETSIGAVAGPPAVTGAGILVAGGDGIHTATLRNLDPATGALRWQTALPGWWDDELEPAHDPVLDPATAYLLDGMGTVVAVDAGTGNLRWRQETGRTLVDGRLVVTPGAVVFASYDDELVVLDRVDGRIRVAEPQRGVPVDLTTAADRLVVALRLASPSRVEARPEP
jgi:outer membrane protein assembly factor BamB